MKRIAWALIGIAAVALWTLPARADEVRFGRSIVIDEGRDAGDVVCIGCSITVRGTAGDVVAVGGSIEMTGSSRGDAVAVGGSLRLGPAASIKGDAVAVGGQVEQEPGSTIGGETQSVAAPGLAAFAGLGLLGLALLLLIPLGIFGFVLALILYGILGEPRIGAIAWTIQHQTPQVALAGAGTIAALCALCYGFAHAGPLSGLLLPIAGLVFVLLAVVGYTGLSYLIGGKAASASGGLFKVFIGALIITGLQMIPIVNIVAIAFILMALGGAVMSGLGSNVRGLPVTQPPPAASTAAR